MTHIIGERYRKRLETAMDRLNADVLWLPDNPDVDPRLAGHADLSVYAGNGYIVAANEVYPYIVNYFTNVEIFPTKRAQGIKYPQDAGLCVCSTGKYDIYNPKTVDPAVRDRLNGIPIEVSQGYTKCSVCVVSKEAIITSDRAISSSASNMGMDVLEIVPGYVFLEGFREGFIGGASFLLNKTELAFTGTLERHPDKERILSFLAIHGKTPVFLTNDLIFDIGGAVAPP